MRFLKVLLLVPLITLAACDQKKSDAATVSNSAGSAGAGYDTSKNMLTFIMYAMLRDGTQFEPA